MLAVGEPNMTPRRYELSDYESSIKAPLLPNKPRGVERADDRKVLTAFGDWAPVRRGPTFPSATARRRLATIMSAIVGATRKGSRRSGMQRARRSATPNLRSARESSMTPPSEDRHGFDVAASPVFGEPRAKSVAVAAAIGEKDLALSEAFEHVVGAAPVAGLAGGQLQESDQAVGVDERMDLGGQAAPRAPHADASSDVPSSG
jgi:hypothetical protein